MIRKGKQRLTRMLWHGEGMKAEGGLAQRRNKPAFYADKMNIPKLMK